MDQQFQRVCDLFEEARHLAPGEERQRFLDAKCDAGLRPEVESMLEQHEASADADSIAAIGPELGKVWHEAHAPPERIGPYRVLGEIGSGGSGTVYEAEQSSPKRRVAIKVLHAGLSPRARRRFEREGEILAQLSHEGIARIYAMEQNAFVMELVDGVPITRYCEGLPIEERLRILVRVCDIIVHAHQRGVIHRDLKPSNILVTGDGNPKVLDFGLARRVESDGQTMTGLVMGTLGYMSPEQANARPGEMDTRTDVYALGVIGYELLSGELPHRTENRPITEVLLEIGSTDAAPLSLHDKRLRGDLSVIFAKALARDREQRYQSAGALAEDIERYLNDEPILARGPAATYQLRKFVKRHKALVSGLVATILALAIGLGFALRFAREADRSAENAAEALARARIGAAANDLGMYRPSNADHNLELVPPEHRGWEWHYFRGRVDGPPPLLEFPAPFAPPANGAELASLWSDPEWSPWVRRFFPSELLIDEHQLRDMRTGRPFEWNGVAFEGRNFRCVAASDDRDRIAISGYAMKWEKGAEPFSGLIVMVRSTGRVHPMLDYASTDVVLSPDGTHVAASYGDYRVLIGRVGDRESVVEMRTGHFETAFGIAISPDNRFLATGTIDSTVRIHDWRRKETIRISHVHSASVYALCFSPDGRYLASGGGDRTVSLWDLKTGDQRALGIDADHSRRLRFSEDGKSVASWTAKGLRRWSVGGEATDVVRHHTTAEKGNRYPYVYDVSFSEDGRRIASAGWDNSVRITEANTGRLLRTLETEAFATGVAHTRTRLVATTAEGLLSWDHELGTPIRREREDCRRIVARPGSDEFAATSRHADTSIVVRDARTLEPTAWACEEAKKIGVYSIDYTPDGRYLAMAGSRGRCFITDADTGRVVRKVVAGPGYAWAMAFGPEGRLLAVGSESIVVIFDWRSGRALQTLQGHVGRVFSLAFNPDGTRLASGCRDSTLRIWDPRSGTIRAELHGHQAYIYGLDWSPDGRVLASASGDNTVRLWRGG